MNIDKKDLEAFKNMSREIADGFINLQPIQRGGILPPESKKTLLSYGDGYSICDYCFTGRMDQIEHPNVHQFLDLFAKFVDMDVSFPTASSRDAKRIIIQQLASKKDVGQIPILIVDALAHYSTYVAAENANVEIIEVPHTGYPEFRVQVEEYGRLIDQVNDDKSKFLVGALLTHCDYLYGNISNLKHVGQVCHEKGVPFIVNGAYSVGVMPFSGKEVQADFVTASGHKSMSSSGPIGMLSCKEEYSKLVFPRSRVKGNWSGRTFHHKIKTLLGCPAAYGAPIATLMSSFPHIVERTKIDKWKEEIKNARYFIRALERINSFKLLGDNPHDHTLMQFETPSLQEVSKNHQRKGFFLYNELKERGIVGIFPGMVKSIKLNVYGLTREQIEYVAQSFLDIAKKYKIIVN
ncbi:MAG: O-phospho-L-seryl-tRNA:Cys-tRNA synthase [Promethearchaeota archaeon]